MSSFPSSSSSSSIESPRYVSYASFNLDASNKTRPELSNPKVLFDVINTIIGNNFAYPDIITFTEVASTKWIDESFEKETRYWGVYVPSENNRLKIYTCWNKTIFDCLRIIHCPEGRYVCFQLQHLVHQDLSLWYISIHGHKKDVEARRDALDDIVSLCRDFSSRGEPVIVVGDFNDNPSTLQKHVPAQEIAITSPKTYTTQRKNSIDNSFLFNGSFVETRVDDSITDFTHYPIKYIAALCSLQS